MKLAALMLSCPDRAQLRAATLRSLASTDWKGQVEVLMDGGQGDQAQRLHNIACAWRRLVALAASKDADFYLLMEDDIELNRHLEHNLRCWSPLRGRRGSMPFFASLYNPSRAYLSRNDAEHYLVAAPYDLWGSQALLVSHATAEYFVQHWDELDGPPDLKMPRLATRLCAIYYHLPSLAQHTGVVSTWGGIQHVAGDYDASFRAAVPAAPPSSWMFGAW